MRKTSPCAPRRKLIGSGFATSGLPSRRANAAASLSATCFSNAAPNFDHSDRVFRLIAVYAATGSVEPKTRTANTMWNHFHDL